MYRQWSFELQAFARLHINGKVLLNALVDDALAHVNHLASPAVEAHTQPVRQTGHHTEAGSSGGASMPSRIQSARLLRRLGEGFFGISWPLARWGQGIYAGQGMAGVDAVGSIPLSKWLPLRSRTEEQGARGIAEWRCRVFGLNADARRVCPGCSLAGLK
jgi:hypothetical protein